MTRRDRITLAIYTAYAMGGTFVVASVAAVLTMIYAGSYPL